MLPPVLSLACSSANIGNKRKPASVRWSIRRASIETVQACRGRSLPFKPNIADDKLANSYFVDTDPVGFPLYPFTACCGVVLGCCCCAFVSGHHRAASLKLPMNHVLLSDIGSQDPGCAILLSTANPRRAASGVLKGELIAWGTRFPVKNW